MQHGDIFVGEGCQQSVGFFRVWITGEVAAGAAADFGGGMTEAGGGEQGGGGPGIVVDQLECGNPNDGIFFGGE